MDKPTTEDLTHQPTGKKKTSLKILKYVLFAVIGALLLSTTYASYLFAVSPGVIRDPKLEHYHFRMQVLVNGKAEDFGSKEYQTGYVKDQCNANLPEQPIHFHDNVDQFTHIHWEGMTGGLVMKQYGWNFIGGTDDTLGYKLNDLADIQKVTTHGNYLPAIPEGTEFYIYTGDESSYSAKSFADWRDKDLEEFFDNTSNSPAHEMNKDGVSILDQLFPKAYAHGAVDDGGSGTSGTDTPTSADELTRINNLIGNVVIFVQKEEPSNQQIKERFNNLVPLTNSTCGG